MAPDEYAAVGGGALKLKGGKVNKKKKKKDKSGLEKNLGEGEGTVAKNDSPATEGKDVEETRQEEDEGPQVRKTETELRHEEVKKKRLLKMAESSSSRPELLKTHKERVEELNTYLSKLSEHHDMPKIGPG